MVIGKIMTKIVEILPSWEMTKYYGRVCIFQMQCLKYRIQTSEAWYYFQCKYMPGSLQKEIECDETPQKKKTTKTHRQITEKGNPYLDKFQIRKYTSEIKQDQEKESTIQKLLQKLPFFKQAKTEKHEEVESNTESFDKTSSSKIEHIEKHKSDIIKRKQKKRTTYSHEKEDSTCKNSQGKKDNKCN